jgi:hypothetical protein
MHLPLYPWRKSPLYQLDRRFAGLQSRAEQPGEERILDLTGIRTSTHSQPLNLLRYRGHYQGPKFSSCGGKVSREETFRRTLWKVAGRGVESETRTVALRSPEATRVVPFLVPPLHLWNRTVTAQRVSSGSILSCRLCGRAKKISKQQDGRVFVIYWVCARTDTCRVFWCFRIVFQNSLSINGSYQHYTNPTSEITAMQYSLLQVRQKNLTISKMLNVGNPWGWDGGNRIICRFNCRRFSSHGAVESVRTCVYCLKCLF